MWPSEKAQVREPHRSKSTPDISDNLFNWRNVVRYEEIKEQTLVGSKAENERLESLRALMTYLGNKTNKESTTKFNTTKRKFKEQGRPQIKQVHHKFYLNLSL